MCVCAVSQNANEDTSQLTPKERIRRNKEQQMQVGGRGLVREVAGGLSGKWQGACQGSGGGRVRGTYFTTHEQAVVSLMT